MNRAAALGKQFSLDGQQLQLRGITYGTFAPRDDGARFPARDDVKRDFATMCEAGFNVVRTYTLPPDDVVELAADWGLMLLPDVFFPDWRYLVGRSRHDLRQMNRHARQQMQDAARRFADNGHVFALSLGNEIPADVIRWFGTSRIARTLEDLADVIRQEDPSRLVTYANYPTAEYLPLEFLDFLTFNVFLEDPVAFRRYLTRLQHLAGDRPLILGEMGMNASGDDPTAEVRQAQALEWQLETVVERGLAGACVFSWTDEWHVGEDPVDGWHFGLTRADRSRRPALEVATRWNGRTVADVEFPWPSTSVVVCAYNAAETIEECLAHATRLDYPAVEVIVVDDGSTDATADIARRFPTVKLHSIPHAGLSVARNEGFRVASGELVAYLDSDAYPPPDWLRYLALGMDDSTIGGVGGPNVPPREDPFTAQAVARAPGGPVHVLVGDDRAEHIPGCNMAFWRKVLVEVGGFDPVYTSAGDDVDLCWKVLERGWNIGFHPAALVWHHRRGSVRAYLRQQRGYGKAEALVEARHPDKFTPLGSARWRGSIYSSFAPSLRGQRIYRGEYGSAAYQSVYRGGGHLNDLLHQAGVPVLTAVALCLPLVLVAPALAVPVGAAVVMLLALGLVDALRARPPRGTRRRLRFRALVALMHLAQPLVRTWGRMCHRRLARRARPTSSLPGRPEVHGPALLMPADRPREVVTRDIVGLLHARGMTLAAPTGWEAWDASFAGSAMLRGTLLTSGFPEGCVQVTVRRRLRIGPGALLVAVIGALALLGQIALAAAVVAAGIADLAHGWWRTGGAIRRIIREGAQA